MGLDISSRMLCMYGQKAIVAFYNVQTFLNMVQAPVPPPCSQLQAKNEMSKKCQNQSVIA